MNLGRWFSPSIQPRQKQTRQLGFDRLEDRVTPAVDLSAVTAPNILVGKHTLIPLSATDTAGLPLKYTVTSTNSAIQGGIITKGRTLVMEVAGGSGTNAFTGTMLFHLFEDQSPKTTARIIELVNSGFYNGLTFHRVVKGFVAQGGDPTGTGTGGSGTDFDDEYNVGLTFNSFGLLAMANAGDDDNDSQFFITETAAGTSFPEHLNFNHNIFGQLVEGADVLQRIMNTPVDGNSKPTTAVIIKNAYLINDNQHAVLDLSTTLNAAGSGQITVKVTNSRGEVDSQTLTVNVVTGKVNEVVTLTEGTNITAGTYTLSFGGQTTANIAWDATAAQVQAALEALSTIGAGNIAVAGGPLTTAPLTLTFRNQLGSRDVGPVTSNQTNLTGTFTIAVTTPGSSDNPFLGTLFDRQTPTNTPITFDVSATDLDNTQLTFVVRRQDFSPLTDADNVTVTVTSTGLKTARITITPADGFTGLANLLIGVVDETENIDTQPQDKFDTQHFNLLVTDDPISPRNLSLVAGAHVKPGNVVTLDTPTIQFLAPANKTVNVFVNGTQVGTATQFSQSDGEGTYRFTLPNNALVLGSNTITAVTAENGVNSLASTPFTLTFTPSLQQVYVVPGAAGTQTSLTFDFLASHTSSRNEVGVYVVDDMTGSVNGVSPSSAGYRQAVLSSPTRQVLFSKQPGGSTSAKTLSFAAGTKLAFYFVQNKSAANATSATRIYFSFKDANPDKIFHDETFTDHAGRGVYGWEESFKGGDRDFNDMVFAVRHVLANPAVGAVAVDIANPGTTVKTSFSLLPTLASRFRPIGGEIGIFPVLDALGTVRAPLPNNPNRTLKPGDDGYAQAALGQQGVQVIFTRGDVPSASKTRDIEMAGGSLFGVYYLPRGTAASFLDSNPGNSIAAGRINVFFSFASANPDGGKQHMRTFPKEQESRLGSTLLPALNDPQRIHLMGRINGGNANFSDYILTYQQSIAS